MFTSPLHASLTQSRFFSSSKYTERAQLFLTDVDTPQRLSSATCQVLQRVKTARDGFELEIFKLVREHATCQQWREWLRAPLEHAAAVGNMDLFVRLMDAGVDASARWRGCNGRTLLGAAAYGKSEETVMALLKAGAKDGVNVKSGARQWSALHVAAAYGAERLTNALMLAGANPKIPDGDRQTPLHVAAEAGHHGVVNVLLQRGAEPDARRKSGEQTPLHLAAAEGHAQCVSVLMAGGVDNDTRNRKGATPLHLAARNNRLGVVEELLAAGADVEARQHNVSKRLFEPKCPSALDWAAMGGHVNVVRALLRYGSSASSFDDSGRTTLHRAVVSRPGRDNSEVIRVLLEAGADVNANAATRLGETPLHQVVTCMRRNASNGTILALLNGGANVNSYRLNGSTPLHIACYKSCVDAVELLLCRGADENLTDEDGKTPEDVVGSWEEYEEEDSEDEEGERQADDQRICHMLARAPADRSWRRRGWLVMARSCPTKVQLAHDSDSGGERGGNPAKTTKAIRDDGNRIEDKTRIKLEQLVGRVVGLGVEGVFRLVVGFL